MLTRIKSVIATAVIIMSFFSSVVYTACNKPKYTYIDPCEGIECKNNGICISGACDCTTGYTGQYCEKKAITPYLGKWSFSQQLISSNNNPVSGPEKKYEVTVTEGAESVTFLNFNGLLGDASFNASARIAMEIGYLANGIDSILIESYVVSTQDNFVFPKNQPLGSSKIQLLKGEGHINNLGTQMSGDFTIVYPDSAKGSVQDKYTFSATYIN
ncbi:MAG: calcium-binding EGF-like domain-containing protein [Chitinophagales bacterium]|nr:calcium-binding EGF-like domain-containing protein [Chitinophagales bacterium]